MLEAAYVAAVRAVQLDPNLPQGHAQLALVLAFKRQREAAVGEFERARAINPNFTDWRFPAVLVFAGQAQRAIGVGESHLRADPFTLPVARGFLGLAYFIFKRYPEAVATIREFVSQAPNHRPGRMWLTAAYAHLGSLEEARAQAAELLRIDPLWTSSGRFSKATAHFRPEDAEHLAKGLRKAGFRVS